MLVCGHLQVWRLPIRAALASDEVVERIVADTDGQLIGSVLLYPAATNAYNGATPRVRWPEVRLLVVAPTARGQGVATALMHECMARARRATATELGLHTSDSMQITMHLYERLGFERVPSYDFQPNGAKVVKAYRLRLRDVASGTMDTLSS